MDSSRRWITVFGAVIAALAFITLVVVLLTGNDRADLLDEGSPEGTVQRYLLAIQQNDWQLAYTYLSSESFPKDGSYDEWLRSVPLPSDQSVWKATLGGVSINGSTASVKVSIDTFRPSGPFENPVRSQNIDFQLTRNDGIWSIVSPPYVYWVY